MRTLSIRGLRCLGHAVVFFMLGGLGADGDEIEFLSGLKLVGQVKQIRKAEREFDFESQVAGRTFTRTYPFAKVHAVTMDGKRYVLTPKPTPDRSGAPSDSTAAEGELRSAAEIRQMIRQAGETPPDWFAATQLNYPPTLDLSWPESPEGGWNNRKNVGQFLWDVVYPNPGRWRSGIKLMHQILESHRGQAELYERDRLTLAKMYFNLLQDYARAAYWLEQAKPTADKPPGVMLAECYWRLGSRRMALEQLRGRSLHFDAIKLYGDMGDIEPALRLTRAYANSSASNDALIVAGDALRRAGRLNEAIEYYQQVIDSNKFRNKEYEQRFKSRARDSIAAIRLFDRADVKQLADGKYRGQSMGYNGPLQVEVIVTDHRIESVKIASHSEKQFYSALTDTPRQIVDRQGVTQVDATSGATITSNAIVNAAAQALASGKR